MAFYIRRGDNELFLIYISLFINFMLIVTFYKQHILLLKLTLNMVSTFVFQTINDGYVPSLFFFSNISLVKIAPFVLRST